MTDATRSVSRASWREGVITVDTDRVVAEVPVALVYNGISHVVMMATPGDLDDLAADAKYMLVSCSAFIRALRFFF